MAPAPAFVPTSSYTPDHSWAPPNSLIREGGNLSQSCLAGLRALIARRRSKSDIFERSLGSGRIPTILAWSSEARQAVRKRITEILQDDAWLNSRGGFLVGNIRSGSFVWTARRLLEALVCMAGNEALAEFCTSKRTQSE